MQVLISIFFKRKLIEKYLWNPYWGKTKPKIKPKQQQQQNPKTKPKEPQNLTLKFINFQAFLSAVTVEKEKIPKSVTSTEKKKKGNS